MSRCSTGRAHWCIVREERGVRIGVIPWGCMQGSGCVEAVLKGWEEAGCSLKRPTIFDGGSHMKCA